MSKRKYDPHKDAVTCDYNPMTEQYDFAMHFWVTFRISLSEPMVQKVKQVVAKALTDKTKKTAEYKRHFRNVERAVESLL